MIVAFCLDTLILLILLILLMLLIPLNICEHPLIVRHFPAKNYVAYHIHKTEQLYILKWCRN